MHDETPTENKGTERCWIETDRFGRVTDISPEAARLLHVTARVKGRVLLVFFTEHRTQLAVDLDAVSRGLPVSPRSTTLRPKDRKSFPVVVLLKPTETGHVVWQIERSEQEGA